MPAFHHLLEIQISYTFKFCDKSLRMFLFFSFSPVAVHQHWLFKERRRVPLNIYSIFLCPLVCSSVSKSARYIHATSPISHKPRNLFHCLQCMSSMVNMENWTWCTWTCWIHFRWPSGRWPGGQVAGGQVASWQVIGGTKKNRQVGYPWKEHSKCSSSVLKLPS